MFLTSKTAGRALAMLFLPCLFTACRQEQLSLPVAHADEEQTKPVADAEIQSPPEEIYRSQPGDNCYLFMLRRPKDQRANAVQARLKQFDQMAAALDSRTFSVELVGDHANVIVRTVTSITFLRPCVRSSSSQSALAPPKRA